MNRIYLFLTLLTLAMFVGGIVLGYFLHITTASSLGQKKEDGSGGIVPLLMGVVMALLIFKGPPLWFFIASIIAFYVAMKVTIRHLQKQKGN